MKATKRIVSLALAVLMLLSCAAFVGCEDEKTNELTNQKKQINDLSEELILQMKYDYLLNSYMADMDPNDVVVDYYGGIYNDYNYNGRYYAYVVVMLDIIERDPRSITDKVAGFEIHYPDSNKLIVWCNYTHSIYTLEQAYANKMISHVDLAKIVTDFHDNVTHFIDVCDIYDFEDKVRSVSPTLNETFSDTYVDVTISAKLSKLDDLPIRYFGSDLVEEITDITPTGDPNNENYRKTLRLKLRVKSKKNVLYAINVLEEIPGIVRVYAVDMATDPLDSVLARSATSTDQWAIENIL